MRKAFRNKTNQSQVKEAGNLRTRTRTTKIVAGEPLPLRVLNCHGGKRTSTGKEMLHFEFQHLESQETFSSNVFEAITFECVANQIINAILPEDVEKFELQDLINGGIFATLNFNSSNGTTYINVRCAEPLNQYFNEILDDLIASEQNLKEVINKRNRGIKTLTQNSSPEESEDTKLEEEDDTDFDFDDDLDLNSDDESDWLEDDEEE